MTQITLNNKMRTEGHVDVELICHRCDSEVVAFHRVTVEDWIVTE